MERAFPAAAKTVVAWSTSFSSLTAARTQAHLAELRRQGQDKSIEHHPDWRT